mmetsp:Transcript_6828/g.16951  ORF Transcript_6828/g.16951 Transcript_6828/m.16951 type:complete len:245 (-) Transcript_6828:482-1216(-)
MPPAAYLGRSKKAFGKIPFPASESTPASDMLRLRPLQLYRIDRSFSSVSLMEASCGNSSLSPSLPLPSPPGRICADIRSRIRLCPKYACRLGRGGETGRSATPVCDARRDLYVPYASSILFFGGSCDSPPPPPSSSLTDPSAFLSAPSTSALSFVASKNLGTGMATAAPGLKRSHLISMVLPELAPYPCGMWMRIVSFVELKSYGITVSSRTPSRWLEACSYSLVPNAAAIASSMFVTRLLVWS